MSEIHKMVVFQAGQEEYAFRVQHVISIEKVEGITPIPHTSEYIKGVASVRGELIPVIDLEMFLYSQPVLEEGTRMIVLQTEELAVGVIVKDAKEIIDIFAADIKQLSIASFTNTAYLAGIANLDSRLITIVDAEAFILSLDGIRDVREYLHSKGSY